MKFLNSRSNKHWWWFLLGCLAVLSVIWTMHNQSFYHQPIGRVEATRVLSRQKQTDEFNNVDYQIHQQVRLKIMNGHQQGQHLVTTNTYTQSKAMDQKYRVGQQAFITQLKVSDGHLTGHVTGLKRDTTIVILLWVVVILLVTLLGKSGAMAFISALLNIVFFICAVKWNVATQANYILAIFMVLSLMIALVTLTFVFGWNKQSLATLAATILGVAIAIIIFLVVSGLTGEKGIYYESMQYVTQNYRLLYLAEVMIGVLGAVMDESSDILTTLFEVKKLNPRLSWHQLYEAGRNVGRAVMGPLTNILLMIFLFSTLTNAVLFLRNGNSWGYTFKMCMSLGVAQSLVSGIGIVVTIPLVSGLAAYFLTRR